MKESCCKKGAVGFFQSDPQHMHISCTLAWQLLESLMLIPHNCSILSLKHPKEYAEDLFFFLLTAMGNKQVYVVMQAVSEHDFTPRRSSADHQPLL